MKRKSFTFSSAAVQYYFNADFSHLEKITSPAQTILIADENFISKNKVKVQGWKTIVVPSGEDSKVQRMADKIIERLIEHGADKSTTLVGIGGGMVTDMTGYVAALYKRGVNFGFVPATILAMTDAAIGGKNGINIGLYKNMVGTICQPKFILYDYSLLKTLPKNEWINGFAEIIKHACISDTNLFKLLEVHKLSFFQKDKAALAKLIEKNALLKTKTVLKDEFEKGERKLLNFGHTIGHAIENLYRIPHGHAVSIGMVAACKISEKLTGFKETDRVIKLLKQYGFSPQLEFDKDAVWKLVLSDKKKSNETIDYILLNKIGKASIVTLPLNQLKVLIEEL